MTELGLVVFDLDGTLLRGPTVCEVLAQSLGRADQMARIEAYSDEADIATARAEMAGWYDATDRARLLSALKTARWAPGAQEGVARLRDAGATVAIASITWAFAAQWFAERLGVSHVLGTGLGDRGDIAHVWSRDKAGWLSALAGRLGVPARKTAAVGDTEGDLGMLATAGCGVFVGALRPTAWSGAHLPNADIRAVADHILADWKGA